MITADRFIVNYRFNNTGHSINTAAPTICTVGQIGVASCNFIDMQYGMVQNALANSLHQH
jgi:hypothetical protein